MADLINLYSYSNYLTEDLAGQYQLEPIKEISELKRQIISPGYSLIVLDSICSLESLRDLEGLMSSKLGVIYLGNQLSKENIYEVLQFKSVVKILDIKKIDQNLSQCIEDASQVLVSRQSMEDILAKVRSQNKTLEGLNENLESIVAQRTHHLELSTSEIQEKNRSVRDLTKFIKALSSIEALEDLMFILKQEFIKYHKINPPVLFYSLQKGQYRCIYFQGPQLIDKPVQFDDQMVVEKNTAGIRQVLVDELGRPVNPILSLFMENIGGIGVFIFEHNMDSTEQSVFQGILEKRYDSLKVAFEQMILKLRAHEISKQWSLTFDALEDPIVIIDSSYRVIRSNKVFNKNIDSNCFSVFTESDSPCFGCPVQEAKATKLTKKGKISVGDRMYEVNAYPIYLDGNERFQNMIVHYTDITMPTDLQSQLIQSEKMAAIGLLAGNIAHELNNPLTGIHSLAQLLLLEVDKESILYGDLNEVKMAAGRSQQIIKNLLEFSSFKKVEGESVSVREVALKTLPFLKTAMRYQNSQIDLSEDEDCVAIEPHLLQQVIFNLINNACQAMGDSGTLSLVSYVSDKFVDIEIKDTGPGIPEAIQQAVFTPFFTTKEEGKGTGLGLSMSRSVVERFGGTLEIISTGPEGTVFKIRLGRVFNKQGG